MKKKNLLLSIAAACCVTLQAAAPKAVWTDELPLPREWNRAAGAELTAVSPTGEVYVAGVLQGELDFAGAFLESDYSSTYLLKYAADGSRAWAVHLNGAATPTAITVADDGSVYVAGTLADEVTLGSTDGHTQVIDGVKDGEAYISAQAAAFIARYSAEGALLQANSYKPQRKDDMDFMSEFGYDIYMHISGLQLSGDKLLAGLTVGGRYESAAGVDVSGSGFTHPEMFVWLTTKSGYVVSLDDKLDMDAVLTKLALQADETLQNHVFGTAFAVSGNDLLVAYTSMGGQVLTVGGHTEDITFTTTPVEGDVLFAKGYLIAAIDLETKALKSKAVFENVPLSAYDASLAESLVKSLDVTGSRLVLSGIFENELPFDNEITSVDATNAFTAVLNKADLTVEAARSSRHESDEFWASSAVLGDSVYVAANDTAAKEGHRYLLDLQNPTVEQPAEAYQNRYLNALAAQGRRMAQVEALQEGDGAAVLRVSLLSPEACESGMDEVTDYALTFYPNPVKDVLHLNKPGDIRVYSPAGIAVAEAAAARELSLQSLPAGSYILSVRTADGVRRLPFIKE